MGTMLERAFNALPENLYETHLGRYLIRETQFTPEKVTDRYLSSLMLGWKLLEGKRILDLGACTGGFAKIAEEHGVEVVSLDNDPKESLQSFARGRPRERNIPYHQADMRMLPYADNSFDAVISMASVHWAVKSPTDMETMLREARRVTRDGGFFRFTPGNYGNLALWEHTYQSTNHVELSEEAIARNERISEFAGGVSTGPIDTMHLHIKHYEQRAKVIAMVDVNNGGFDPIFWHIAYGESEFNTLRLFY